MTSQIPVNASPEWDLMLCCVRAHLAETPAIDGQGTSTSQVNWKRFLKLARRHRVVPHVHSALTRSVLADIPGPVMKRLESLQANIVRKNLQLTGELVHLLREFKTHNIDVIPFKGPVLAIDSYGGLHRRQFIDLDVLVKPEAVTDALRALQRLDYRNVESAIENLSGPRLKKFLRRFKSHTLTHASGAFSIDLHWRLSEDAALYSVPFDDLTDSDSHCIIGGERIQTMSAGRSLEYQAFHACKHGCMRLSWLCDVATAAAQVPNDYWNQLLHNQNRASVRMVIAAIIMLESLSLTDPLDDRIRDMAAWRKKLNYVTSMMLQALMAEDGRSIHGANVGLLRWKLSGNLQFFIDSILRAFLPKQDDLVERGLLKPHLSRWNYLINRGVSSISGQKPPEAR